jgi:hypothetical protein
MIDILIPLHTVSEANSRDHYQRKAKRARQQRTTIAWFLRSATDREQRDALTSGPLVVTLTRQAPSRGLDGDNLQRALKAIRDGVADFLGLDDADPRVTWKYQQSRSAPRCYAVGVTIGRGTT